MNEAQQEPVSANDAEQGAAPIPDYDFDNVLPPDATDPGVSADASERDASTDWMSAASAASAESQANTDTVDPEWLGPVPPSPETDPVSEPAPAHEANGAGNTNTTDLPHGAGSLYAKFVDQLQTVDWDDPEAVDAIKADGFRLAQSGADLRAAWNSFAPEAETGVHAPDFVRHRLAPNEVGRVDLENLTERMVSYRWPRDSDGNTALSDVQNDPEGRKLLADLTMVGYGDESNQVVPQLWRSYAPTSLQDGNAPEVFRSTASAETASAGTASAGTASAGTASTGDGGSSRPADSAEQRRIKELEDALNQQRSGGGQGGKSDVLGLGAGINGLLGAAKGAFKGAGAAVSGVGAAAGASAVASYRHRQAEKSATAANNSLRWLEADADALVNHPDVASHLDVLKTSDDAGARTEAKAALQTLISPPRGSDGNELPPDQWGEPATRFKDIVENAPDVIPSIEKAVSALQRDGQHDRAKDIADRAASSLSSLAKATKYLPADAQGASASVAMQRAAKQLADMIKNLFARLFNQKGASAGPAPG